MAHTCRVDCGRRLWVGRRIAASAEAATELDAAAGGVGDFFSRYGAFITALVPVTAAPSLPHARVFDADVRFGHFQRARMQAAHFEGAKLSGARFEEANLDDPYFYDAELDDVALSSIVRARNSRSAHWDYDVDQELKKRAARIP